MANLIVNILYVILAVVLVVFLDFKYFRYEFWKRFIEYTNCFSVCCFLLFVFN